MELWFLSNPALLKREREAFSQLENNESWLVGLEWSLKDQLCVYAIIRVHEYDYKVKLVYPAYFPDIPPAVYPQETDRQWSMHQYGDKGCLCLEWGPDNWLPQVTGAELIRSTHKLLSIENPLGNKSPEVKVHAPSRHHLEMGQELRNKRQRCLITRDLEDLLKGIDIKDSVSIRFSYDFHPSSWVVMLPQISVLGSQAPWIDPRIPTRKDLHLGAFIKIPGYKESLPNVGKVDGLFKMGLTEEWIAAQMQQAKQNNQTDVGLLISNGVDEIKFYLLSDDGSVYCFEPLLEGVEFQRTPDGHNILSDKKVGIVGLGSLGSKIAVTLARSGVRNFYLVDYDLFMPDNIKRHVLNWKDVGEHKVDAVKNELSYIDKNINVESKTINLTGQESASYLDVCLRKMASCDLIIDATANDRVFNLLASVAKNEQKKFLWTVVFEGGKGGQVARYIPSKDPMPQLIRAACNEFYLEHPLPDTQIVGKYAVENEDGRVFIASDTDVSAIADNAAKFAIDCLAEIYEYEYPVYLIGLGKWWVFKSPLHVIPIDCGHLAVATVEQSAELDDDGKKFLIDLIKKVPMNEGHPA